MGVDSGLPDFRGPEGFWRAYPAYRKLGVRFEEMANPRWFDRDPQFAWGFYGHRLKLYRDTVPHAGFKRCLEFANGRPTWVFTSNVDGQFQRAGFPADRVVEVHGSIHHLQCCRPCHFDIWSAKKVKVEIETERFTMTSSLPQCPRCNGVARPNILMFGDGAFVDDRTDAQAHRYQDWLSRMAFEQLVLIEMGAGSAVPTVRYHAERLQRAGARLIRINPRESQGPPGTISLAMGAKEALERLVEA